MFVGIIDKSICIKERESSSINHYSMCGKKYKKNKFNIISFNQKNEKFCKQCIFIYESIYGQNDSNFTYTYNQQNIILNQEHYKIYNKGKRHLKNLKIIKTYCQGRVSK
jgi:hypothetical protein